MERYPIEQVNDDLFLLLRTIYHYERSVEMDYGLDFRQIYALQFLRRNPDSRITEIAEEMKLPKFAVSRLISQLVDNGFVSKSQDLIDHRNYRIVLDGKGEQIIRSIEAASYQQIAVNIQELPLAEIEVLVKVAQNLHIVLGVTDRVIRKP